MGNNTSSGNINTCCLCGEWGTEDAGIIRWASSLRGKCSSFTLFTGPLLVFATTSPPKKMPGRREKGELAAWETMWTSHLSSLTVPSSGKWGDNTLTGSWGWDMCVANICSEPGTVLCTRGSAVSRTHATPALMLQALF